MDTNPATEVAALTGEVSAAATINALRLERNSLSAQRAEQSDAVISDDLVGQAAMISARFLGPLSTDALYDPETGLPS